MPGKDTSFIIVRSKQAFLAPPGPLGFNNLIEPDTAFDSLKFNVQTAYSEEAVALLISKIDRFVIEPLWPKFLAACKDANTPAAQMAKWTKPEGAVWVDDHLKQPNERAKVQLPTIQFDNAAEFKDKNGVTQRKTMKAYSATNQLLDLASLGLGYGSIVQPVLMPGIFKSALVKQPTCCFNLQGVRIITLKKFGGGAQLGAMQDEDMSILEDGVQAEDLSAYMATDKVQAPVLSKPGKKAAPAETFSEDLDDELPF